MYAGSSGFITRQWQVPLRRSLVVMTICLASAGGVSPLSADAQETETISASIGEQRAVEERSGMVRFAGHEIELDSFAGFAGQASDIAYLLVVRGTARGRDVKAGPGEMLLLPPLGAPVSKLRYDAERFAASVTTTASGASQPLLKDLRLVARRQAAGKFWGLYQPTRFNIAAPVSADDELARRSVMGNETVHLLRFSDIEDDVVLEAAIVRKFETALREKDSRKVAALLSSAAFGAGDLRGGGMRARELFAEQVVRSHPWAELLSDAEFQPTDQRRIWELTGPTPVQLGLRPYDDFLFVAFIGGVDR